MSLQRHLRLICALLLLTLVAAACSPIVAPIAQAPVTEAPAAESGGARTVTHALGESEVPLAPQRIIALGEDWMLANLLNLGVKPIASTVNVVDNITSIDPAQLEGIDLWTSQDISLERIVALDPDLIIGLQYWVEQTGYDLLSEIAPVVPIAGTGIKGQYQATAELLGLEELAQSQLAAYDQKVADAAAALGDDKPTVSVGTIYGGPSLAAWVGGPDAAVPTALVDLGIELHPDATIAGQSGATQGRAWLSNEQIPVFDGDILILLQTSIVEGEAEAIAAVEADPLWALLPAVQSGNVIVLDRLGAPGFAGLEATLDQLVEILNGGE